MTSAEWPAGVPRRPWSAFALVAQALVRLAWAFGIAIFFLCVPVFVLLKGERWDGFERLLAAVGLAAMLASALWGWRTVTRLLAALRNARLSKLASAAPGYLCLEGRAHEVPGERRRSPVTGRICCWYGYRYDPGSDRPRTPADRATPITKESDWPFLLKDGAAECTVHPAGATVFTARTGWQDDVDWREVNESYILPSDWLLVIGAFSQAQLQKRVWVPRDGSAFIISTLSRRELAVSLKIWAWIFAILFLLAVAFSVYAFRLGRA